MGTSSSFNGYCNTPITKPLIMVISFIIKFLLSDYLYLQSKFFTHKIKLRKSSLGPLFHVEPVPMEIRSKEKRIPQVP
jgi:hypothetical protein